MVEHRVLDAADYAVPQHRRRTILLAARPPCSWRPQRAAAAPEGRGCPAAPPRGLLSREGCGVGLPAAGACKRPGSMGSPGRLLHPPRAGRGAGGTGARRRFPRAQGKPQRRAGAAARAHLGGPQDAATAPRLTPAAIAPSFPDGRDAVLRGCEGGALDVKHNLAPTSAPRPPHPEQHRAGCVVARRGRLQPREPRCCLLPWRQVYQCNQRRCFRARKCCKPSRASGRCAPPSRSPASVHCQTSSSFAVELSRPAGRAQWGNSRSFPFLVFFLFCTSRPRNKK